MTERRQRSSPEMPRRSDALDLEKSVFTQDDPRRIARSLERSQRRWSIGPKSGTNLSGEPMQTKGIDLHSVR
jgi:hypothetical protein